MTRRFLIALAIASLFAAAPAVAVPALLGGEFQVNVTTLNEQRDPSIAAGPDGRFLVVWTSYAGPEYVVGRVYDASGSPQGGEFPLAEAAGVYRSGARVAAGAHGSYLAVWEDHGIGGGVGIVARAFDGDGGSLGASLRVDSLSLIPRDAPAVAATPDGFVVVWIESNGVENSIRGRLLNPQGQTVGGTFRIDLPGSLPPGSPSVAAFPSGGFVVAWLDGAGNSFQTDIRVRRFQADGSPLGAPLHVNADPVRHPGNHYGPAAVVHDGGFSVVWDTSIFSGSGTNGHSARRYTAAGVPAGEVIPLGSHSYDLGTPVAALANPAGGTLLLWPGVTGSEDGILGRFFDPSWQPAGPPFQVNTYEDHIQTEPAVAFLSTGDFVAAWASGEGHSPVLPFPGEGQSSPDGDYFGVFAQRFSPSCAADASTLCLQGGRFQVRVNWETSDAAGPARAVPHSDDTGFFWFFGENNLELIVKILDGRIHNGHFWVFTGALSNVGYEIEVTDTLTNEAKTYANPPGRLASRADTAAFQDTAAADLAPVKSAARLVTAPLTPVPPCSDEFGLCLGERFRVDIEWKDPRTGLTGRGHAVPLTGDTGAFWFFGESNLELVIKILDGGSHNGHFWVFFGAVTDLEYTLWVFDNWTWQSKTYHNDPYQLTSRADTHAFPGEEDQP